MSKKKNSIEIIQESPDFSTSEFRDFIVENVPKTQMFKIKVSYAIKKMIEKYNIQVGEKKLFKKLEKDGLKIDNSRFYFSWLTIRAYFYGIKKA